MEIQTVYRYSDVISRTHKKVGTGIWNMTVAFIPFPPRLFPPVFLTPPLVFLFSFFSLCPPLSFSPPLSSSPSPPSQVLSISIPKRDRSIHEAPHTHVGEVTRTMRSLDRGEVT